MGDGVSTSRPRQRHAVLRPQDRVALVRRHSVDPEVCERDQGQVRGEVDLVGVSARGAGGADLVDEVDAAQERHPEALDADFAEVGRRNLAHEAVFVGWTVGGVIVEREAVQQVRFVLE